MLREMQLVWRFNRGHTDALREIYDEHKHDLVTLATALLVDKSEAEDVVHDVFVGFIQCEGRFRLTGSLKGFLATCVANRARNLGLVLLAVLALNRSTTSAWAMERAVEALKKYRAVHISG